jgi:hypothetical protein
MDFLALPLKVEIESLPMKFWVEKSDTLADLTQSFSPTCPPPHWSQVCSLLSLPENTASQFLRGGWREVPESARWWDDALGGEVEEKRKRNLDKMKGIREGMHNTTVFY